MIISASGLSVLVLGAAKTYGYQITLQICRHPSSTIQLCSVCCNKSFSHPCLCDRLRALKGPCAWCGVQWPQGTVGFLSFCQQSRPHGQMKCWTKQWKVKTWKDFVATVSACCILHTWLIMFGHVCVHAYILYIYHAYISYYEYIMLVPLLICCLVIPCIVFSLPECLERLGDCASKRCLDIWSGCHCCIYIYIVYIFIYIYPERQRLLLK